MKYKKQYLIFLTLLGLVMSGLFFQNAYNTTPKKNTAPVPTYYDTTWPFTYMSVETWPPEVTFSNGQFACIPSGDVISSGGKTIEKIVDQKVYCVTEMSEGAAGSVYTTYTYKTLGGDGVIAETTFVVRAVQCANYDDQFKTACEVERSAFDIDTLVHRVIENKIE